MERIAKYSSLKKRSSEMGHFIKDLARANPKRDDYLKLESDVLNCANYLVFNNYYTVEEIKLAKAHTCKKHLLCPFCATRRAGKLVEKNLSNFTQVTEENPHLIPAMITLTVKNGADLEERFNHLRKSFKKLQERRRDWLKKGRGHNEFCKIQGAAFSYEIAHNHETGWHPHIHMVVLLDNYIDVHKLSSEWQDITGDSYIVDVRKLKKKDHSTENTAIADAMLEVFKYAVKFADLSLERQFEAYEILKSLRLIGSFGLLHGVKLPDTLLDDISEFEDLPYLEMYYRFNGRKGAYDLTKVQNVTEERKEFEKQSFGFVEDILQKRRQLKADFALLTSTSGVLSAADRQDYKDTYDQMLKAIDAECDHKHGDSFTQKYEFIKRDRETTVPRSARRESGG